MPILLADRPGDVQPLIENAGHEQQDVLEVDDPALGLALLVALPDPGHRRVVDPGRLPPSATGARGIRLGGEQRDLAPLDLRCQVADGGPVELHPQPPDRLGYDRSLARQDLRSRAADRLGPEEVQLSQRRRVEGPRRDPADPELAQPGAHLPRGPRGEGDRKDALRHIGPRVDPIGDPVGDRPGLPGPRAGQDAHRAQRSGRDLTLLGVEGGQHGIRS